MTNIAHYLSTINKTSCNDESERLRVLHEARALVSRLQKPHEFVESLIWINPFTLLAVKIASDMRLFAVLSDVPQTVEALAELTQTDGALLRRILRMLGTINIVHETAIDTYVDGELSKALKVSTGPISGIEYFWPMGASKLAALPQYLKTTAYHNPGSYENSPFSHIMDSPSFWDYLRTHPETQAHFNSYMSSLRQGQAPWTDVYPINTLLEGLNGSNVLCVDVGGGKGRDMTHLRNALPTSFSNCRIIVQDLPAVIAEALRESLQSGVEMTCHDFFTAQPIRCARVYFMHSICHDWPDVQAEDILSKVGKAMQPGYSKLLLYETVMPTSVAELTPRMAAMDLNMMCHFAALERTEAQWKALLAAVGMRWVTFYTRPGAHQGIIEAELNS